MRRLGLAVLALAALAVAGCGGKSDAAGNQIVGRTLTIYSSLPLHGASSIGAQSVLDAERLALTEARDRIGRYQIVLASLDDSTTSRGQWDPGQTTINARIAIQNRTTIGYLGEFNSGASAVSIPLLNRIGIPQVSPSSTAVGLTSRTPGASPGEPEKYYPTGTRTYARVVPNDSVQAAAQVGLQRDSGCRRTYVLDDGEVDGQDMATSFVLAAQAARLPVVGVQTFVPRATDYSSLAATVVQAAPDCVLISAITESGAVLLTRQLAAALPHALLFGSAGLAESSYVNPADGGIPSSLDPRILLTAAALSPQVYPAAAQSFVAAYLSAYDRPPEPYAIFGYEAMSLMLSAIRRATDNGRRPARRSKVRAAIFATRDRPSVLGTYSIDRNGDTSLRRYGVYRVVNGRLSFDQAIDG